MPTYQPGASRYTGPLSETAYTRPLPSSPNDDEAA